MGEGCTAAVTRQPLHPGETDAHHQTSSRQPSPEVAPRLKNRQGLSWAFLLMPSASALGKATCSSTSLLCCVCERKGQGQSYWLPTSSSRSHILVLAVWPAEPSSKQVGGSFAFPVRFVAVQQVPSTAWLAYPGGDAERGSSPGARTGPDFPLPLSSLGPCESRPSLFL